ncbi:MAG: hypothetical protein WC979_00240 [Candidatus Pacearchaeota archaeon]|jgi:hypothetical protein|nr:hypothetical protein [Clostridia bacterium]
MGVFKEEAKSFETVESKQYRIYKDAADYGYAYNSNNIPAEIKLLIDNVKGLNGTSLMKSREAAADNKSWVNVVIEIAWEIDEGMECGTHYAIGFCKITSKNELIDKTADSYISVYSKNYRRPYKN